MLNILPNSAVYGSPKEFNFSLPSFVSSGKVPTANLMFLLADFFALILRDSVAIKAAESLVSLVSSCETASKSTFSKLYCLSSSSKCRFFTLYSELSKLSKIRSRPAIAPLSLTCLASSAILSA